MTNSSTERQRTELSSISPPHADDDETTNLFISSQVAEDGDAQSASSQDTVDGGFACGNCDALCHRGEVDVSTRNGSDLKKDEKEMKKFIKEPSVSQPSQQRNEDEDDDGYWPHLLQFLPIDYVGTCISWHGGHHHDNSDAVSDITSHNETKGWHDDYNNHNKEEAPLQQRNSTSKSGRTGLSRTLSRRHSSRASNKSYTNGMKNSTRSTERLDIALKSRSPLRSSSSKVKDKKVKKSEVEV